MKSRHRPTMPPPWSPSSGENRGKVAIRRSIQAMPEPAPAPTDRPAAAISPNTGNRRRGQQGQDFEKEGAKLHRQTPHSSRPIARAGNSCHAPSRPDIHRRGDEVAVGDLAKHPALGSQHQSPVRRMDEIGAGALSISMKYRCISGSSVDLRGTCRFLAFHFLHSLHDDPVFLAFDQIGQPKRIGPRSNLPSGANSSASRILKNTARPGLARACAGRPFPQDASVRRRSPRGAAPAPVWWQRNDDGPFPSLALSPRPHTAGGAVSPASFSDRAHRGRCRPQEDDGYRPDLDAELADEARLMATSSSWR